jgi:BASS family bile acid:Na+ symporter
MFQRIKDFMMPIAMLIGGLFYNFFAWFAFLTPYLIFFMLLFTFSKLSPKGIRFEKAQFYLLAINLFAGGICYFALHPFNHDLAQGALICFLQPTATAAAVITGLLGGSIGFVTSFTLMSNFGVCLFAPLYFTLAGVHPDLSFVASFVRIFIKIFPLLILPLLTAWAIRFLLPRVQATMLKLSMMPFYLWSISLAVVTGRTVQHMVKMQSHNVKLELALAFISLFICVTQFAVGKFIGKQYNNRIAAGQSLGQKNTILAIWMAQVFLDPIVALAPSTYILWQNIINSYQVWKAHKREREELARLKAEA